MSVLEIGLVNNMPDAALEATERQFRSLLAAAAGRSAVRLRLFALPDVPRSDAGREHIGRYSPIDELWNSRLDGLIVTGTEPRAANLMHEPYWAGLVRLADWAEDQTTSCVWSCLAAHAAVLHLDGITRHKLSTKRFGVFDCSRADQHPMTAGPQTPIRMPHSRWNDLQEDDLRSAGYRILLRSEAGVDAFAKERRSLFVFFQGHPEYVADTLLLEYRRDIKRFLRRESDIYPVAPCGYFDSEIVSAWNSLRDRAMSDRCEDLLTDLPPELKQVRVSNNWRADAALLYGNWLSYIAAREPARVNTR